MALVTGFSPFTFCSSFPSHRLHFTSRFPDTFPGEQYCLHQSTISPGQQSLTSLLTRCGTIYPLDRVWHYTQDRKGLTNGELVLIVVTYLPDKVWYYILGKARKEVMLYGKARKGER